VARILREQAVVERVEGDIAYVVTESKLACQGCKSQPACGNGLLEQYFGQKKFVTPLSNNIGARPGQKVLLEAPSASVTKASLLIYWLPLAMMLSMALIADYLAASEAVVSLSGVVGLGFGFMVAAWWLRRSGRRILFEPRMTSILSQTREF